LGVGVGLGLGLGGIVEGVPQRTEKDVRAARCVQAGTMCLPNQALCMQMTQRMPNWQNFHKKRISSMMAGAGRGRREGDGGRRT
jgi:hypothetical protein